jgi:hypothetical protein
MLLVPVMGMVEVCSHGSWESGGPSDSLPFEIQDLIILTFCLLLLRLSYSGVFRVFHQCCHHWQWTMESLEAAHTCGKSLIRLYVP